MKCYRVGWQLLEADLVWIVVTIAGLVALWIWVPTIKRRIQLEQAMIFGREFYEVDLEPIIYPGRHVIVRTAAYKSATTPQEMFFAVVGFVWKQLSWEKQREIEGGFEKMALQGALSREVRETFVTMVHADQSTRDLDENIGV